MKSNRDIDWGKHYDIYEIEFRDMYRNQAKPQNDSFWVMLKTFLLKKDFPTNR